MKIKTDYNPKPIPDHRFDWDAWDDDTLDIDSYVGHGATEREAIEDLKQHYDTFHPDPETMEKWGDAIMEQVGEDRCELCKGSGRVTHPEAGDQYVACGYCLGTGKARRCPHGKLGECSACDFEGDLAFDAAREDRVFGRR